jgi:transcriptional regulator with XRE-family HTH domain
MERNEVGTLFRERLGEVIEKSGLSRSAFASAIGLDRSTLSQLLSPENERLPRAETVIAMARQGAVSTDWLLGVNQEPSPGAELVSAAMEIEPGAGGPTDARLDRWHKEAEGYKIRYVPSSLPDLLKTEDVIRYEYRDYGTLVPDARLEQAEARLAYSRLPETDMEVCSAFQSIESFARGEGIWRDLPVAVRREQLKHMRKLCDELYPTFRWFLFDGLQRYAAPVTIFGPKRAALYVGTMYFVFTGTEQIRVLTRYFDDLIRAAVVQPPDIIDLIDGLIMRLPSPQEKAGAKSASSVEG